MPQVIQKRWAILFCGVAVLVLAQVAWWVTLFLQDVSLIEKLRFENQKLLIDKSDPIPNHLSDEAIREESRRRRLMFWSESLTFAFLTCFGLYLLFHALRVEEEARKTQKDFIDMVSHESKTPITALTLRLESAIEKTSPEQKPLKRDLTLALNETRRLTSLFDNTMNLNRLERQGLRWEKLNLAEVSQEIARSLDPFLKNHGVELILDLDKSLEIEGDLYSIQNVLQNLIENAAIYNRSENKKIWLKIEKLDSRVCVQVHDNGPGVDPQEINPIFDKYYRGRGEQRIPGTGLGLFIAKGIVRAHQGSIECKKSQKGGSCFEIQLPAG